MGAALNRRTLVRALYSSRLYGLSLGGAPADLGSRGLAGSAPPLWPGDPALGAALLRGDSLTARRLGDEHAFEWLRHLRAVGPDAAPAARRLVDAWLTHYGSWSMRAWRPQVLGRRLTNLIGDAAFLLEDAEPAFRARLLSSLCRQARHLGRTLDRPREAIDRVVALKGWLYAACRLFGGGTKLRRGLTLLRKELAWQVLSDGVHVSRSPAQHLAVLRDLIDVRALAQGARPEAPPDFLDKAIDHMAPALAFFCHADGGLAVFNGGNEEHDSIIAQVLARSGFRADARVSLNRAASGFQRLEGGDALVLVDCGAPAAVGANKRAHAGTLSFEMSSGGERLIVNCGAPSDPAPSWREALRATAAHSTLTLCDTNSSALKPGGGVLRPPRMVTCLRREESGCTRIDASHDGYRQAFGVTHRRRLGLNREGTELKGEDILEGPAGRWFALRFHLHPSVRVTMESPSGPALLRLPSGQRWRLGVDGGTMVLEESVYLGRHGVARRNRQVVIADDLGGSGTCLRWNLTQEVVGGGFEPG